MTTDDTRARFEAQARNEFSHYLRNFHGKAYDNFDNREYLLGIAEAWVKAATAAEREAIEERLIAERDEWTNKGEVQVVAGINIALLALRDS